MRDVKIYVKLPSVPAVVTLTAQGDAANMLKVLLASGHKSKKIGTDVIVIDE